MLTWSGTVLVPPFRSIFQNQGGGRKKKKIKRSSTDASCAKPIGRFPACTATASEAFRWRVGVGGSLPHRVAVNPFFVLKKRSLPPSTVTPDWRNLLPQTDPCPTSSPPEPANPLGGSSLRGPRFFFRKTIRPAFPQFFFFCTFFLCLHDLLLCQPSAPCCNMKKKKKKKKQTKGGDCLISFFWGWQDSTCTSTWATSLNEGRGKKKKIKAFQRGQRPNVRRNSFIPSIFWGFAR